jgi:hypothetical protein
MAFIIQHKYNGTFLADNSVGKPVVSPNRLNGLEFNSKQDTIRVFQQISLLYRFWYEIIDTETETA